VLITVAAILTFFLILGIPAFASEDTEAQAERLRKLKEETKGVQESLNKLEGEYNDELSKTINKAKIRADQIAKTNKQRKKDNEELLTQREEELAAENAIYGAQKARLDTFKALHAAATRQAATAERALETIQKEIDAGNLAEKQGLAELGIKKAQLEAAKQQAKLAKDQADGLEGTVAASEKRVDDQEKVVEGEKLIMNGVASLGGAFLGLGARVEDSILFKLKDAYGQLGGLGGSLEAIGMQLDKTLDPMNIAASVFSKVFQSTINMALAADTAYASFNRTTGAAGSLDDVIMETRVETAALGVSFQDAVAATQELFANFRQFTLMSEEAQQQMVEFTATMDRLGVSSGSTATFINLATSSLGMTADQAQHTARELMATGAALGMLPGEMIEGFNAALPTLGKFGDDAVEVFKGVAAAAKATGADIQSLLGVVGQFDTFEDAANAAGRLNAILGGDLLNSVDLLNASEDERIRMLIQSIELSGRNWSEMGRFERQAVANAAGIRDMALANQMFDTSLAAYDRQQAASSAGAMSQEEMAERARQNTSAQESLANAMESLAIATRPIVDIMNAVLDIIMSIQGFTGPLFLPALAGIIFYMKMLNTTGWGTLGAFGAAIGVFMLLRDVLDVSTPVAAGFAIAVFLITMALAKKKAAAVADVAATGTQITIEATKNAIIITQTSLIETNTVAAARNTIGQRLWQIISGTTAAVAHAVSEAFIGLTTAITANGVAIMKSLGFIALVVAAFFGLKELGLNTSEAVFILAGAITILGLATKTSMGWVGLIATAFAMLAMYILAPMHSPALYIGIFILAAGVFLLGKAASSGSVGLGMLALVAFAVGAAAVMMGFGVMLAAEGIATMFKQLAAVPPAQLFAISYALMALAGAFSAIGFAMLMPWATAGLAAVASGMSNIAAAFKSMSLEKIAAFEQLTEHMESLDPATGIRLSIAAVGVESLADAVDEVPIIRGLILTQIMSKMTDLAEAVTPVAMTSAKEMVEIVKEISSIKLGFTNMILFDKAVDNLVKILQGAGLGSGGAGTGGKSEPKTVILEIDKRQFAKTVIELINEKYDLKAA